MKNRMVEWIDINDKQPDWYEPVLIRFTSERSIFHFVAWRHTDGEKDDYTIFGTDVILNKEPEQWMKIPK